MGAFLAMLAMGGADAPPACLRALRPLGAGQVAARADFEAAPCGAAAPALGYDRAQRVARLRRAVAAGEVVRGSATTLAAVRSGQTLVLESRLGPVTVQRTVEALRAAPAGAAVMVRAPDGAVFAAPPPAAEPHP